MTRLVWHDFRLHDLHVGHVYATNLFLRVGGDGSWWFAGSLEDKSVVYGDNYGIGFTFEDLVGPSTGKLGADLTSSTSNLFYTRPG
jgi:hypothetical protein